MANFEKLFREFPPVSAAEWEEKIKQDLKGTAYGKLVWNSIEGPVVKPFYTEEDLKGLDYLRSISKEFPSRPKNQKNANDWDIRQDIKVDDPEEANLKALNALNGGVSSLGFIISEDLQIDKDLLKILLKNIYIDCISLNFSCPGKEKELSSSLIEFSEERKIDFSRLEGSIDDDPLCRLSIAGHTGKEPDQELKDFALRISVNSEKLSGIRSCCVNGSFFQQAGSSIIQELGFSLAVASEYMDAMTTNGIPADVAAKNIQLNLAIGPVYFMEIAKFRAAGLLFTKLAEAWEVRELSALNCFIHAETTSWNHTIYDHYTNILRGTTEAMSAIIGGANSVAVNSFDSSFRNSGAFPERIARNTQIILKEEAYLDKVKDAAAGSYYIESLTNSIAEQSWELFLKTEQAGGYLKALKEGFIQKEINETAAERDRNLAFGKQVLLGTNRYPDAGEKFPDYLDEKIAFQISKTTKTNGIIKPLKRYRGAIPFEKLRLRTQRSKYIPKVFLLSYGDPVMRKARAGFAYGFFASAGYKIIENPGFKSIGEGIKAAISAKADIVVLCSSDVDYPETVPAAVKKAPENMVLVVAGYPVSYVEELKRNGIKHFIHMKSNIVEEIEKFHELMNIS